MLPILIGGDNPPAISKGWIDRVFRPGIAYEFVEGDAGEGVPIGLLKAKSSLIFNTSNTESSREIHVFKDPLKQFGKIVFSIFVEFMIFIEECLMLLLQVVRKNALIGLWKFVKQPRSIFQRKNEITLMTNAMNIFAKPSICS